MSGVSDAHWSPGDMSRCQWNIFGETLKYFPWQMSLFVSAMILHRVTRSSAPRLLIGPLMANQASDWPILAFLSALLSNHPISDFKRSQCRVNEPKKWERCWAWTNQRIRSGELTNQRGERHFTANGAEMNENKLISICDKLLTPAKILKLFILYLPR